VRITKLSNGAVAALFLAFFAFGASVIINRTVFERLPHLEDEFAYLYQAKIFAGGHAWVSRNEPVKVFWQPFVLQPETSPDGIERRFGKYTPGWPLLLAPGTAAGAPWVINAFMGALTVVLTYRLGKEIFGEAVGVCAAALMAVSPMALLLNATLMSHTSALTLTMTFLYAYWRTTRMKAGPLRNLLLWGALGGVALGLLVISRPLTAVAMAAPVGLHALSRLLEAIFPDRKKAQPATDTGPVLQADGPAASDPAQPVSVTAPVPVRAGAPLMRLILPLIVMGFCSLPLIGVLFGFNYAVTGQARSELYTMLWEYDKPGFGTGYGLMPGGHSLTYGWRNFNADFSIWARDLFGFTLNPAINDYLKSNLGYGLGIGISVYLVVIGLVAGRKSEWIWLLFELFIAIVIAQLTYWIGSTVYGSAVYSVRYYYEATGGLALVAGYGIVALARSLQPARSALARTESRLRKAWQALWPGYILFEVALFATLLGYTPDRFREPLRDWPNGLYGFNKVGRYQLDNLATLRQPGKKVLVVVLRNPDPRIEDNWRDYAALMAETSPYLDSDIIVARLFDTDGLDEFKQRFPDRQVLYQVSEKLFTSLADATQKPDNGTRPPASPPDAVSSPDGGSSGSGTPGAPAPSTPSATPGATMEPRISF
jgi:hypothetical protein